MTRAQDIQTDAVLQKANILKALAHPVRVRVFEVLAGGEKTVGEIVQIIGEKEANTSRHLAVLRAASLVATRKDGLNVYYSNKIPCLLSVLSCLDQAVCDMADEQMNIACCIRNKA